MSNIYLDGLNEAQRDAVTAPFGNILVLAGAGSGKTRVLVSRIAWLIDEMALSPNAILAVTFTNKAAGEMKERLKHLLNDSVSALWVGTFHGLCHRLLRRHYVEARLPQEFHILDSDDQSRIIKRVIDSLNLDTEQWPVKQAQAFINSKKDEGLRPQHVYVEKFGPMRTWLQIYQTYEQACQAAGVIDFAELLLRTHELLRDNEILLRQYQDRFKAILVDEFQDTNAVQYAWIRLLANKNTAVMAVGDDDQSIYGWRGAKVENIQCFPKDFPGTNVIRLEQNYRSTSTILAAANALIAHNDTRMGKELWTTGPDGEKISIYSAFNEIEEARFVSERIKQELRLGREPNDIAILYRSNAQSRVLEESFLHTGITYRIHGGVRFYDRAEVKDTLAYMRLLLNPNDAAAFERVVNFPTRGIGEKTLIDIRLLAHTEQLSLWQAALRLLDLKQLPQRASTALAKFIHLMENLKNETIDLSLDEQLQRVINDSGLYAHFAKMNGELAESKLQNLQELVNAAKEFRYDSDTQDELPLLVTFLAHASLEAGDGQALDHESSVHMMTLHSAKGLEFPLVFLVGMEEGLFPGKQSINDLKRLEEERRLCYVGMTRAMERLTLTYAEVRRQYGREEYHRPSRFLNELPTKYIEYLSEKPRYSLPESKRPISSNTNSCGFRLGQTVNHAKFGQGVVLAIEGSGAHTRVQVRFIEDGTKWLVLTYANLS